MNFKTGIVKFADDFKILSNSALSPEYFVLELLSPRKLPEIGPGQFVQVLVENSPETFLRRPFSIHDVDYDKNTICLYIKIVGEGTLKLSKLQTGTNLNVVYPLGNSFTLTDNSNVLLIGGGCGVAPLLYLARKLARHGNTVTTLIGGRCKADIYEIGTKFKEGDLLFTTEDNSLGEKGFVTHHSIFSDKNVKIDRIYSCGPEPMLKSIAALAASGNIPCEVSLENTMACGFGVCLCCVVDTTTGNRCVCTEGPVFNINELKW